MGKEKDIDTATPTTPWGFLGVVLKRDGVQGVLLLVLCWLNYDAGRQAREERNQFRQTYEAMAGKADSSAIRAHDIAARALEREIQTAKVVEDNTRVLRRVERRLPKARVENEEG